MPVSTGSVHAHTLTNPSRAGIVAIHSEFVEPGAAACLSTGMAGPYKFWKLSKGGIPMDFTAKRWYRRNTPAGDAPTCPNLPQN